MDNEEESLVHTAFKSSDRSWQGETNELYLFNAADIQSRGPSRESSKMKNTFGSQTFATQKLSCTPPILEDNRLGFSPKPMKVLKSKANRSSVRMSRNTEILLVTDSTAEGNEQQLKTTCNFHFN